MKVNGTDIRKYDAKQLAADVQPPSISVNYEWITGANVPTEFDTEVKMGHLKLSVYFKGKNRNSIVRSASEFMAHFTAACDLELDGFKGKYRGFMTGNDYEKTRVKSRYIVNLEFDGFFFDDELEITFDRRTSGVFYMVGSRESPCTIEIYANSTLSNYSIKGFGTDDIVIEKLAAGKTLIIDGRKGIATVDGVSAFGSVSLWEFPSIKAGATELRFSNSAATVKIRYRPMWI